MLKRNLVSKKGMVLLTLVLFFGAICFGNITSAIAGQTCEGDFNGDGDVDGSDLAVFAADFGRTDCDTGDPCQGDFDNDNDVDGSDLAVFAADFGRTDCDIPFPPAPLNQFNIGDSIAEGEAGRHFTLQIVDPNVPVAVAQYGQ